MQKLKKMFTPLLQRLGLYESARRLYGCLWNLLHGSAGRRRTAFFRSFETFREQVKSRSPQHPTLVLFGYLQDSRKALLFRLAEELGQREDLEVLLCTNSTRRSGDEAAAALLLPFENGRLLQLPVKSAAASRLTVPITAETRKLLNEKPYLQDALQNARASFPQAGAGYAEALITQYYLCFQTLLDCVPVSGMLIWNAFKYHHGLLAAMCRERGIPVLFAEFGVIPGTLALDTGGQMGESLPAVEAEAFLRLPVSEEECFRAQARIAALRSSGLNRNVQQDGQSPETLKARLKSGRPTLLFAGQCDRDSGMIPYGERARQFHSPLFPSTVEAVIHVAKIAEENDWNLVFRPHPMAAAEAFDPRLPKNVIAFSEGSINDIIDLADAVITILSSTAYISLIRGTPCVMLGYNQLRGKGCVYEAADRDSLPEALRQALDRGYTPEQQAAFVRHVAQLGKYYLFSDGRQDSGPPFGRSLQEALAQLETMLRQA